MATSNEPTSFPMLYKIDSQGATRCWRTWTVLNADGSATEHNESGIVGGALTGIPITVTSGKNIGKKNETTPLQQANKRIASKYTKKLREGYVEDLAEFTQQGVMSALEWRVGKHRMSPVALKQPKIDGIRCNIKKSATGQFSLTSKQNKEFKDFLYELPWAQFFDERMPEAGNIDGEMYIHGLELNEIASLVMSYKMTTLELRDFCEDTDQGLKISLKKKEILDQVYIGNFACIAETIDTEDGVKTTANICPSMGAIEIGKNKGWIFPGYTIEDVATYGTTQLEFWAFDMPDEESFAEIRNENLKALDTQEARDAGIVALIAEEFNISDIEMCIDEYIALGFEGIMIRRPAGLYAFGSRSADLQKYKRFFDAEWEIVAYEIDRQGNPTLIFVSDTGERFSCRPKGNRAWRAQILRDIDHIIGKRATIRYQKLFADTLVPQFGRVIAIRDYE